MTEDAPNPVDVHVGTCIRARRIMLRISQTELADALGISFQQVQKYERGTNRVSASALYAIQQKLGVPMSYFFDGFGDTSAAPLPAGQTRSQAAGHVYKMLKSPHGFDVAMATANIRKPENRRAVVELIKELASYEA